ncbi:MAG: restriction endonuclease subunit S [Cyanobacteria bacterium MAG CAR3_bin_5]|nr:restriction endonuclease subunit S [Cyanobacteria bacterium MAG CAR3_bin_5]
MSDGLKAHHRAAIIATLAANHRVEKAVLFGSRAMGANTVTSDVDIALFGRQLTLTDQAKLAAACEELPMAQSVDLVLYSTIDNPALVDHIHSHGVEWYRRGAEWKTTSWGQISTLEYGKGLRDYKNNTGKFPVYGTNGAVGTCDKYLCNRPGIIVGRKGAYRGVHYSNKPFYVIDTAYWLNHSEEVDTKWAYYQLLNEDINSLDSGSAIPSTSKESFYSLSVLLPPLPEQKAIAHVLSTIDDKIELNRQMNETLEAMAKTLFKSWFVDFDPVRAKAEGRSTGLPDEISALFPDSFEDSELGEIPRGWGVATLGKIMEITMGQSPPGSTYNQAGEGLPFYQGRSDFQFRHPRKRVFCSEPSRVAQPMTTLMSVRAPVGSLNVADQICCIGRGVAALQSIDGLNSYAYYLMDSLQEMLQSYNSEGTVFGAINKKDLASLKVLKCELAISKAFNDIVASIDGRISLSVNESKVLTSLRDSLLPRLISGELKVPGIEKTMEVAA